jgi:hypothetical protein
MLATCLRARGVAHRHGELRARLRHLALQVLREVGRLAADLRVDAAVHHAADVVGVTHCVHPVGGKKRAATPPSSAARRSGTAARAPRNALQQQAAVRVRPLEREVRQAVAGGAHRQAVNQVAQRGAERLAQQPVVRRERVLLEDLRARERAGARVRGRDA